jgi:hypothetical protein
MMRHSTHTHTLEHHRRLSWDRNGRMKNAFMACRTRASENEWMSGMKKINMGEKITTFNY